MNICYNIPAHLRNEGFYEKLRAKLQQSYKDESFEVHSNLIVPKKSGRCIFVERGNITVEYTLNIDILRQGSIKFG